MASPIDVTPARNGARLALILVAVFGPALPLKASAADQTADVAGVRSVSSDLIGARNDWQRAATIAERTNAERRMLRIAAGRIQALARLVESDPAEALRIALPFAELDAFPASVQPYLEARRSVTGTLEVRYADYADRARRMDVLRSLEGQWTIHYTGAVTDPMLRTGARVVATGLIVGDLLALDPGAVEATTSSTTLSAVAVPLPNVAGEQRLLVVLVNFAGNTAEPYTPDYVRSQVFGEADAWYRDVSAGQTWLAGDVTPWNTLDLDPNVCDIQSVAAFGDAAVRAQGFDPATYDRIAYVMPGMTCGWAGLAGTGSLPTRTWLTTVQPRVFVHELAHNFGLHHSRGRVCADVDPWSTSCQSYEYGDFFDIMGNAAGAPFNALQMRRLGYLDGDSVRTSTLVTAPGQYQIGAYAATTAASRALRIPAGVDPQTGLDRTLYVTLRQPVGRDATLKYAAGYDAERMSKGVVVNAGWESGGDVFLIDSTPLSRSGISDLNDAPILVGESLTDPYSGVTVAPVEVVDGAAIVSVDFGAPSAPAPSPDVPPVAVDDSAAVSAGGTVAIPVMSNDYDPDGEQLAVASVGQPAHGQVSIGADGVVSYRPARKFAGVDSFTYLLSDGAGTDTATVTVTVTAATRGRGR